jgi:O-antigen/teichoic acid export membrane protein
MFVFALCKPIYQLLFVGDYVRGYIVSPYLFLSPLVMLLLQVATNQLMVVKRTSPNVLVLGVGAVVDVALNLVLIPRLGIEGAAIATLSAYVVSLVVCVVVLAAMGLMVVNVRLVAMVLLMCAYVLQWRFLTLDAWWLCLLAAVACCGVALLMYRRDVAVLLSRLRDMGKNAVKGDGR